MKREFILQGLTTRTHIDVLREMFKGKIEAAIISVAFVSENGVRLIEPELKRHASKVTVFAGIRNEITSAQALRRLIGTGVSLFVVDTGSRSLLFHPKIYHVRSAESASLAIGSANLTLGGLNNNIEAGLLLNQPLSSAENAVFVNDIEALFYAMPAAHPENVFPIKSSATVDQLLAAGRVVDELALRPPRPVTSAKTGSNDATPRMKMLPKPLSGSQGAASKAKGPKLKTAASLNSEPATVEPELELVWESKPLSRRSLGIPSGQTSNPTGSTTLGSGTFDHINRVTYFRDQLFGHLAWTQNGQIETADQAFDLVIKGIFIGTLQLTLRHSLTRAAAAAADHNSPTSLSWNQARSLVARTDLLGRTMRLWRSAGNQPRFRIDID